MPILPQIRFFQDGEPYDRITDNRPLRDLSDAVNLVNTAADTLTSALASATGSAPDLETKLSHLGDDGVVEAAGIASHPISSHTDTAEYVVMTSLERDKLSGVSELANRFSLHINEPTADPIDGDVVLQGGRFLTIRTVPNSSGVNLVRIDTAFSPDKIHEHRGTVRISKVDGAVAQIPNSEAYTAGSLEVFVNGLKLAPEEYAEVSPYTTFKFLTSRQVDLARDVVTASFEVKPSWSLLTTSPMWSGTPAVKRWVRADRLGQNGLVKSSITATLSDGSAVSGDVWMIDITDLDLVEPYELFKLYLNGSMMYYGIDWDIVSLNGRGWLRWRYYGADSDIQAWMLESSDQGFAEADLAADDELQLDYFSA